MRLSDEQRCFQTFPEGVVLHHQSHLARRGDTQDLSSGRVRRRSPKRVDVPSERRARASKTWPPNRAKLVKFAEQASQALGVSLEDNRSYTERIK